MSQNPMLLDVPSADLDLIEGGQPSVEKTVFISAFVVAGVLVGGPFGLAFAFGASCAALV